VRAALVRSIPQWVHVLAGALCGLDLLTAANLRGNEPFRAWAALLVPFGSGLHVAPHCKPAKGAQRSRGTSVDAAVAIAGWAFSICLALATSEAAERAAAAAAGAADVSAARCRAAAAGAWCCAIGATASDACDALALILNGRALKARGATPQRSTQAATASER